MCINLTPSVQWLAWHIGSNTKSCFLKFTCPYICCSVFRGTLTFCFAEFDTTVCDAVFMLCLGSFLLQNVVLKSLSVGFQLKTQSLKYSMSMFQRKVDNWKPQAGGHVTGLCSWSISGWNDLLLSLPTGVFPLPVAALLFTFLRAVFCAAPWLTECLEEAKMLQIN